MIFIKVGATKRLEKSYVDYLCIHFCSNKDAALYRLFDAFFCGGNPIATHHF